MTAQLTINTTGLDLEPGDNVRWFDDRGRLRQGRLTEMHHDKAEVTSCGRLVRVPVGDLRLSYDLHTRRRRAERGAS